MPEILSIGELLDLGNSAATAGLVPYSALEYDGTGRISGISGSAIAGGVDSAVVSSIVSSYVESGVSGKVDQSAFDDCCSSVQSALSGKLDASASGQFAPSGDYMDRSASSMFQPSGDYYSASNPSGFITSADLSSKLDASASSQFAPSGDYVFESSYSSFSGDVINNISSMSSIVSGLTGEYIETSASSMFQPSGNYASATDFSAYVPFSGFEYSGSTITAISGSAIGGSQGFGQVQSDWTESASASASYIQHKPTTKPISAGAGIQIVEYADNVTIAGTVAPQVQSNWTENDSTSASYIRNRPSVKPIVAGANISIIDSDSQLTIASLGAGGVPVQANWSQADSAQADYILNKPTGLAPQVQSNWAETSTSSKAFVLNKPATKPIIAGAGISITENATAIIISLA